MAKKEMARDYIINVAKSLPEWDTAISTVMNASDEERRKFRRRVEDYLRKCRPAELALVVAFLGIDTNLSKKGGNMHA